MDIIFKYGQSMIPVALTLLMDYFLKSRWSTLGQLKFFYNAAMFLALFIISDQVMKLIFSNLKNTRD